MRSGHLSRRHFIRSRVFPVIKKGTKHTGVCVCMCVCVWLFASPIFFAHTHTHEQIQSILISSFENRR